MCCFEKKNKNVVLGGGAQKDKFLNQLEKDNLGCPDIQNALNSVPITVFVDISSI